MFWNALLACMCQISNMHENIHVLTWILQCKTQLWSSWRMDCLYTVTMKLFKSINTFLRQPLLSQDGHHRSSSWTKTKKKKKWLRAECHSQHSVHTNIVWYFMSVHNIILNVWPKWLQLLHLPSWFNTVSWTEGDIIPSENAGL